MRRHQHAGVTDDCLRCGCAAQTEPGTYAAMREVDAVLGNSEKLSAQTYADFDVQIRAIVGDDAGRFADAEKTILAIVLNGLKPRD